MNHITILYIIFSCCKIMCENGTRFYEFNQETRKVINGREAIVSFPYLISVQMQGQHGCGGSLIASKWVLTAAHCFFTGKMNNLRIPDKYCRTVLDILKLSDATDEEIRKCEKSYVHNDYNYQSNYPDIALIQLNEPYNSSKFVSLAPRRVIERSFSSNRKTLCNIKGWGFTSVGQTKANNQLMEVDVTLLSGRKCKKYYSEVNEFSQLCILEDGKSACHGDSGGPLICDDYQYGIISWNMQCSTKKPVVFTRPDYYTAWIDSTVNCSNLLIQELFLTLICLLIKLMF